VNLLKFFSLPVQNKIVISVATTKSRTTIFPPPLLLLLLDPGSRMDPDPETLLYIGGNGQKPSDSVAIPRYGTDVAAVTDAAFATAGNSYLTFYNTAALGPKGIAKRMAKVCIKGVGVPSTTLAWPGWKQSWIFKKSMGARHRVRIGLSYRPARLHRLAELMPWHRFLGSIKV
jgi:hypothetical protein